jgi:hypothetical protein
MWTVLCSPAYDVHPRPHRPAEQFLQSRFTNASGAADEDADEVLDPVTLGVARSHSIGVHHVERIAQEVVEESRCIELRTGIRPSPPTVLEV